MPVKLTFGDFYTLVWNLVPSVWKGVDDDYGKSLQLILYTMSQHMYYYFYNRIVHMDELFDPDLCPEKYLKFLAGMVGWTLQGTDSISWREQIKAAPLLYKVRGTKRGLLLAEKLVGYSVFMSELYRDHIGDIVPKEKIFNNIPDSVLQKPWFRQVLTSLEGELLPGRAESDQFDSFNQTSLVKLDSFGKIIRPRVLSSSRTMSFTPSSTTNIYNNITGKNSLARYAKLPRINVVLKYDYDLDTRNLDGSIKENNFSSALDLLLQFKPFHVLIQNLEVRYDLSEFIFDQTAINSNFFNLQEETDAAIVMIPDRAENTISYSPNPVVDPTIPTYEIPASPLDNRGLITSIYQIIDLADLPNNKEKFLYNANKICFPVKSFPINNAVSAVTLAASGNKLVTLDDFVISLTLPLTFISATNTVTRSPISGSFLQDGFSPGSTITISNTVYNNITYVVSDVSELSLVLTVSPVDEIVATGIISYTSSPSNPSVGEYTIPNTNQPPQVVYNPGHSILEYNLFNLLPDPILDFKTMLSSQYGSVGFEEQTIPSTPPDDVSKIVSTKYLTGLDSSVITNISISDQPFRSTVTTIYDTQQLVAPTLVTPNPLSRPWDLQELSLFVNGPVGSLALTELDVFKNVYANNMTIVLEVSSELVASAYLEYLISDYVSTSYVVSYSGGSTFIALNPGIDYYFDNTKNIFLNSATISTHFSPTPTTYDFLLTGKLHILYLSRITYEDETHLGIPSRGFRYTTRINNKFTRQFLIDSLPKQTVFNLMPTDIVSVGLTSTGEQQKTVIGTKRFKTPINLYNRSSLKNETIDSYKVVARNPLNRINKSDWTVYSPEYSAYYAGDQKITNNWWGNYYEVKIPDVTPGNPAFIPYSSVDTSEAGQLEHVASDQWLSALQAYNPSNPNDFLVSRITDSNRTSIWNRSSCKIASTPYIRSRRDNLQVFRRDIPTFTRTEESTDYLIDTNAPPRLDNYKYILPDGTDVSLSYFSPGFSVPEQVKVSMESCIGHKATLDSSGYRRFRGGR